MLQNIKLLVFIESLLALAVLLFYLSARESTRNIVANKALFLLLIIPFFGIFGRSVYVFYIFIMLAPLACGGDRRRLVGIYLLLLPQFPQFSQELRVGSHFLFQFSGIYALNLGAFIALITVRSIKPRTGYPLDAAFWLFFLVCFGFAVRGDSLNGFARKAVETFLGIVPPYYVLSRGLRHKEDFENAIIYLILGVVCNSVIAIFESVRHWSLYEGFYPALNLPLPDLSSALYIRGGFMQARAAMDNAATLSLLIGFGILSCLAMRERFSKGGRWALMTIMVSAMIASGSRGGWIGTGLGLAIYLLYTRRLTHLTAYGTAALGGWAVIFYLLPATGRIGDLVGRSGHGAGTATYRSTLFQRGLQEVRAHPFAGQTIGQLQISMNDLRQGQHIIDFVNTHLYVALTLGLGGLVAWLISWVVPMFAAWRSRSKRIPYRTYPPIELPVAMLSSCFAALALTSAIDRMLPFSAMSFGMITAFISINRAQLLKSAASGARVTEASQTNLGYRRTFADAQLRR